MKTLVIDNIDSFVYNLVQYVGILGGNPIVVENTISMEEVRKILDTGEVTHIVISPGPKTPKEAGVTNQVIQEYGNKIPTLGICLGHQCIGHVYGAKVVRASNLMHGKTSRIKHTGNGILKGMENPLTATRYHSLIVEKKTVPDCLQVTAESMDDHEVMGLKHKKHPVYGLQFHPESILTKNGIKIIENFLEVK